MLRPAIFVLLVSALTIGANSPLLGAEWTTLRETAIIHTDSIHVSDLLSPEASAEIRARTKRIGLGNSPAPGAHRTIERFQIEHALLGAPEISRSIIIPAEVNVVRWSQPVTREQVRKALQAWKPGSANPALGDLTIDEIEIPSRVLLTEPDARLTVVQLEPSATGTALRARMSVRSEPRVLPFWITVHAKDESFSPLEFGPSLPIENATTHEKKEAPPTDSDPATAVRSGAKVQLVALAAGLRIATPAIALEIGEVGQKIRVRTVPTGKIVLATVITPQLVQLNY